MFRLLQKPYPVNSRRNYWRHGIGFGLFVFLFLYLLKPFDLGAFGQKLPLVALGYGGITGLLTVVMSGTLVRIIIPRISEAKWTLGKQIGWDFLLMLAITIGNTLYAGCVTHASVPLLEYLVMLKSVLLLGIFPIIISELMVYNWHLRKNLQEADRLSGLLRAQQQPAGRLATVATTAMLLPQQEEAAPFNTEKESSWVILEGDNQNELLELETRQLLAIQSVDNYVTVYWNHNGLAKSQMLRNTLTNISAQLAGKGGFFRCHRGWLVNLGQVVRVEGNAQGYRLQLPLLKFEVPVSRSNTVLFRQLTDANG